MGVVNWIGTTGSLSWSTTGNWDTGAIPVTGDDVYVNSGSADINSGLAQSAVTLASLTIGSNFSGTIGTTATATTSYLQIGSTVITANPTGSGRVKINTGTLQTTCTVVGTSTTSSDTGLEPFRIIGTNASNKLYVLSGTVGSGTTIGGEAATWSEVDLSNDSGAVLNLGKNVTLTTVNCAAGILTAASAITTLTTSSGGTIYVYGSGAITTANVGGTVYFNERGNNVTTLNVYANGVADFSQNPAAITVTTVNLYGGGTFTENAAAANHVTITNFVLKNAGSLVAA